MREARHDHERPSRAHDHGIASVDEIPGGEDVRVVLAEDSKVE
jgi:hypothetical protein